MAAAILVVQLVIVVILAVLYALSHSETLRTLSLYLPPASVMMIVGLILGAIFDSVDEVNDAFAFNPHIFFEVLLPPIIFHSGLTVPKNYFFRNLGTIFTMAFLGTLLSALFIGGMAYAVRDSTSLENTTFVRCMIFGSLLSAVDPVSTIAVFRRANVSKGLYTIVFGESILNDAVAIVIFRVFTRLNDESGDSGSTVGEGVGLIIGITLGSIAFGTTLALITAKIFKHSDFSSHQPLELALLVSVSYLSFIVAEEIKLSGIMSSLFCAIVMEHYAFWNLSSETFSAAHGMFTMLADVAESVVFVYLGMACFTFSGHDFKIGLALASLTWCVMSRFMSVFGLGYLLNRGRKRKLNNSNLFIIFISGLRGAVGFALAMDSDHQDRDVFVTSTLVIVFVTTFIFGGAAYPALKALNLMDDTSLEMTREESTKHWFVFWDNGYVQPYFRVNESAAELRLNKRAKAIVRKEKDGEIALVNPNAGIMNSGGDPDNDNFETPSSAGSSSRPLESEMGLDLSTNDRPEISGVAAGRDQV